MPVNYRRVKCRSILHHFDKNFLPFNWGANPYRGCEHSCPYCFARYTHSYLGYNSGRDFERIMHVKDNAARVLNRELSNRRWKREIVNLGSVCDPYQPAEKKFEITGQMLKVFAKHKNPLYIGTKSNLILRDIDLLSNYAKNAVLRVNLTVTSLDKEITDVFEPRAPPTKDRLEVIYQLTKAGLTVHVLFMPIFPFITDDDESLKDVVEAVTAVGAKQIIPGVMILRKSCRRRFLAVIEKKYPELLPKYFELYRQRSYASKKYVNKISKSVKIKIKKHGPRSNQPSSNERQLKIEEYVTA